MVASTVLGMTTRIDCDTCVVRGLACGDCVVTVLLGPPPELTFDDDAVAQASEIMEQMGKLGRDGGAFGDLVDVGSDASSWSHVLAEGGRDPGWSAG